MLSKLGAVFIRLATIVLGIVSVTLTAPFLGISDFGRFALLQAITAWTILVGLGLPETCSGIISKFSVIGRIGRSKRYLDNSFIVVSTLALVLAAPLAVLSIPWAAGPIVLKEFRPFAVGLVLALLSVPFSLIQGLLNAKGEITRSMAWAFLTSSTSVVSVLVVIEFLHIATDQRLMAVTIASGASVLLTRVLMYAIESKRVFHIGSPSRELTRRRTVFLAKSAYPFLILNVAALAAFQVDRLVSFYFLSPADTARLEVVMKVLMAAYAINTVFVARLWHTVGNAWNSGNKSTIRTIVARAVYASLGFWSIAGITTFFGVEAVVEAFTRGAVSVGDPAFVVTAVLYMGARGVLDAVSIAIFATRNQHRIIRTVLVHGLLNIPMSVLGCVTLGLPGIMLAQFLSLAITSGWKFPAILRDVTKGQL